ncbi:MAG: lyase domain protein repeat-containing protein [Myxococcales bacterium]|nr:lyase domain protein repeat-containing protein [Myxococcales bacterium]
MRHVLLMAFVVVTGCVSDPRDPNTWIKKLDSPVDQKEAVRELVKIKDPAAVDPLINFYKKNHDPEVLKAIATFKDKRQVPVMIDSLEFTEESFDNAATAAAALGETPDPSAVDPLIKALQKPLSVKTRANIVKLEAMRSLGKIRDGKAVPALAKILETPADEQDFFLNKEAAEQLGNLGDARAVPSLVRGLFMTGRGADIFSVSRVSLLQIGKAGVQALIDAHDHKNAALEADAKKYEFRPGVIEQKTALILGDLRAKDAIPAMQAELKKPQKGDNHTGALYALGMIADPSTTKDMTGVLGDAKRDFKVRISAAEALNFAGDPASLPALLQIAKTGDVMKDKEKYPDVRLAAAMAYARLGGPAEAAAFAPVAAGEKAATEEFKEDAERLEVAKKCGKDVTCYAQVLESDPKLTHQEKAAFMLARMGKPALPALLKKLSTREPIVRFAVLFGIAKIADKSSTEAKKALDAQIEVDRTKPPMRPLVEEMRAVRAEINSKG